MGAVSPSTPHIRSVRPSDLDALYDICLRTGDAGEDATHLVEDRHLFGELYAAPYALLEPEQGYVLDDGDGRPTGYVLAALDTERFEARCEAEWWATLRARHPLVTGGTRLDDLLIAMIHNRPPPDPDVTATHPSHLHIDLLPEVQGAGWGRRLLETAFDSLARAGSLGVHWGVSSRNERAIGFYRHLGCAELRPPQVVHTFGVRLADR